MNIKKIEIHQERVSTELDEEHMKAILVRYLVDNSQFKLDNDSIQNVIFSTRPRPGTAGNEVYAKVTLTNDLNG